MNTKQTGQAAIQALGVLFVMLLTGAFAIDAGLFYYAHSGERNAADAAALAAASELFKNTSASVSTRQAAARTYAKGISEENRDNQLNDADIEFGYVDPITGTYNAATFTTPTGNAAFVDTGGYNAVRVTVKAASGEANSAIPSIFANIVGISSFNSSAQAVGLYGGGVQSAGGLRPIYMCQAAWDKAKQLYGDPTTPEITFYGSTLTVGTTNVDQASSCGALGPGNWGLADLDNGGGAPGASTLGDWFNNGYNGQVNVSEIYDSMPGNSLNSYHSELNNLKNNQTVIHIPLYDQTGGAGSNEKFRVSQIAAFVITDFKTTGSNKYLKGYFKKSVCKNCSLGSTPLGGGTTKLRLVR